MRYEGGMTASHPIRPIDDSEWEGFARVSESAFNSRWPREEMMRFDRLVVEPERTLVDVVIEVTDALLPANEGRWRRQAGGPRDGGKPSCERATAEPDLALPVTALGAAYLGGIRLGALAAADQAVEYRTGALAELSTAMWWDPAPPHPPRQAGRSGALGTARSHFARRFDRFRDCKPCQVAGQNAASPAGRYPLSRYNPARHVVNFGNYQ